MASTLEYALMSAAAYDSTRRTNNKTPYPAGWNELPGFQHFADPVSGFEFAAYMNTDTNEIVISYAGTFPYTGLDSTQVDFPSSIDGKADLLIGVGGLGEQVQQAALYYEKIKSLYHDANISFTGHSLGGGLAALMGVFFDKKAVTFDQAPFMAAATKTNAVILSELLSSDGYTDSDLDSYYTFAPGATPEIVRGESKVSQINVSREALWFVSHLPIADRIGFSRNIETLYHGDPNLLGDAVILHSDALLIALQYSTVFTSASKSLPFLIPDLFDKTNLFASATDSAKPDLLTHLIRYEFGVPGIAGSADKKLLSKFASDAALVANLTTDDMDLKQGLMQIAMESYYKTVTSTGKQLFETAGNGIRFDLTDDIGDSPVGAGSLKGYSKLKDAILSHVTGDGAAKVGDYLNESRRMTLIFGAGGGADADDDTTADYMMLGANGGWLNGKGGDDMLVGGNGMDALTGGEGDDTLIGGNGIDSYLYQVGDGNDTIIDSDKKGRLFVVSADGKTTYAASIFTKDKNNPDNYQSADGQVWARFAKVSRGGTAMNDEWRMVA